MIRSRCTVDALPVTISPPFVERAKLATARSISWALSAARCTLIGVTSTASDDAVARMAPNWAIPAGLAESRRTAARVRPGAICLRISSHLPLKPYSKIVKPVTFPPGLARLSTKPAPTGSETSTNNDRQGAGDMPQRCDAQGAAPEEEVRGKPDQLRRIF